MSSGCQVMTATNLTTLEVTTERHDGASATWNGAVLPDGRVVQVRARARVLSLSRRVGSVRATIFVLCFLPPCRAQPLAPRYQPGGGQWAAAVSALPAAGGGASSKVCRLQEGNAKVAVVYAVSAGHYDGSITLLAQWTNQTLGLAKMSLDDCSYSWVDAPAVAKIDIRFSAFPRTLYGVQALGGNQFMGFADGGSAPPAFLCVFALSVCLFFAKD